MPHLLNTQAALRLSGYFFWTLDESLIPLLGVRQVCSEAVGSFPRSCALVDELTSWVSTSVPQATLRHTHTESMADIQGIHFSVFIILSSNARDISVNKYLLFNWTFTSALAEVDNKARSFGRGKDKSRRCSNMTLHSTVQVWHKSHSHFTCISSLNETTWLNCT